MDHHDHRTIKVAPETHNINKQWI
jgi:hypothetical protein